ncbi:MAG: CocE/NonD family hydrolase [Streptosporangiales bacterium]|nr:CocE/NonD family hydrolase [Streptosporangiales bacterium]
MRTVDSLPCDALKEEHSWVPMPDGIQLSAYIWRPTTSDAEPVPGILEYIPYRKRDLTAVRDSIHHPYLAGHGYGCVRADLRGTGESEGVLTDEYLEQEQRDAEDVLAWIAAQPWCTGRTGMMGISWGGFAALQVAARNPPSLHAIVISSFTDDRYSDDMHYMGGCLLSDNLAEAGTMFAHSTLPPDPDVVGDRWQQMWRERLEGTGPWVTEWLTHQVRDDYWRHASVCEDYDAVRCPVLASSGWADGYSNAVGRLLKNLKAPRKGLIGPWSHKYPHLGEPGPAIGYLQEVLRWWDHWLKDADNGVLDDAMLYAWMQDSVPPSTSYEQRPGRWVGEPEWPSPHVEEHHLPLARHRLAEPGEDVPAEHLEVESPITVGQFAGKWASNNAPPDLPYDQREEHGGSLVFETDPLTDTYEILGAPVVALEVSADRPVAMIAARISDVARDGSATRVTYGMLNLTHRDSNDEPSPLEPGRRYRVSFELNAVAQSFPPGHRLSLSTSYWPLAWPPPEPVLLSVYTGNSTLTLPARPITESDEVADQPFAEPEGTAPLVVTRLEPPRHSWDVCRDLITKQSALDIVKDSGTVRYHHADLDVSRAAHERYTVTAGDFESTRGETTWVMRYRRGDWDACVITHTVLTSDATTFTVQAQLDAYTGERRLVSRNWHEVIPRRNT